MTVSVRLTGAESSRLFLAGDVMLSWPPSDPPASTVPPASSETSSCAVTAPFERTSMFVSEAARLSQGLCLRYCDRERAERVAGLLRMQLLEAGLPEED